MANETTTPAIPTTPATTTPLAPDAAASAVQAAAPAGASNTGWSSTGTGGSWGSGGGAGGGMDIVGMIKQYVEMCVPAIVSLVQQAAQSFGTIAIAIFGFVGGIFGASSYTNSNTPKLDQQPPAITASADPGKPFVNVVTQEEVAKAGEAAMNDPKLALPPVAKAPVQQAGQPLGETPLFANADSNGSR